MKNKPQLPLNILVIFRVARDLFWRKLVSVQLIHPNGAHPIWLVDKAAAHKLIEETVEPA